MYARELGHQDLVNLLLQYGAFVDTLDEVGIQEFSVVHYC
jgi:hypothetical protein